MIWRWQCKDDLNDHMIKVGINGRQGCSQWGVTLLLVKLQQPLSREGLWQPSPHSAAPWGPSESIHIGNFQKVISPTAPSVLPPSPPRSPKHHNCYSSGSFLFFPILIYSHFLSTWVWGGMPASALLNPRTTSLFLSNYKFSPKRWGRESSLYPWLLSLSYSPKDDHA